MREMDSSCKLVICTMFHCHGCQGEWMSEIPVPLYSAGQFLQLTFVLCQSGGGAVNHRRPLNPFTPCRKSRPPLPNRGFVHFPALPLRHGGCLFLPAPGLTLAFLYSGKMDCKCISPCGMQFNSCILPLPKQTT